jgi:hypothetical protein
VDYLLVDKAISAIRHLEIHLWLFSTRMDNQSWVVFTIVAQSFFITKNLFGASKMCENGS